MLKTLLFPVVLILLIFAESQSQNLQSEAPYLNQKPPGLIPELFAPGIVSVKDLYEYGSVFSKNGKEFYYAVIINKKPQIRLIKFENNHWSEPKIILASNKYEYNDPFLSPDQSKLYFISDRAKDGKGDKKDFDIWFIKRQKDGWSNEPINAGTAINSDKNEYYMSFTKSGTMYFSSNIGTGKSDENNFDIYSSKSSKGKYDKSIRLNDAVNSKHYEADVFIASDESYIIFCAERPDGLGEGDLFISFKDKNDQWQPAKNMGPGVNTKDYEFCPFVTADGKYLFFSRSGEIYWVSAKVIETLR